MPDKSCVGFYNYYDATDETYNMIPLAFNATAALSTTIPPKIDSTYLTDWTMSGETSNYGFSKTFYTTAKDWADLSEGALFYRFQEIDSSSNLNSGDNIEVWTFASLSPIGNKKNPGFVINDAVS